MKEPLSYLVNAQLYAMLGSLFVFSLAARWYFIPRLRFLSQGIALTALLWVQVPRYLTLILFSAQHDGYPITNAAAMEAVAGDVAGAVLALAAIIVLRRSIRWGTRLCWLLVAETAADMIVGIIRKIHEPLWGKQPVLRLILDVYIPFILIALVLLVRQLLSRQSV